MGLSAWDSRGNVFPIWKSYLQVQFLLRVLSLISLLFDTTIKGFDEVCVPDHGHGDHAVV